MVDLKISNCSLNFIFLLAVLAETEAKHGSASTESLDEVAPMSSFSIRSNYVFGLSESTKELMKKKR